MNVAESADGKIAPVGGGKVNFGSVEDRMQMEALRAEADGVLIGGGTLLAEDPPLMIRDPAVQGAGDRAKGTPHPRNITVCSSLPSGLAEHELLPQPGDRETRLHHGADPARSLSEAPAGSRRVEIVPLDRVGPRRSCRGCPPSRPAGGPPPPAGRGRRAEFLDAPGGPGRRDVPDSLSLPFGGRTAPTPFDGEGFPRDRVRKLALKSHRVGSRGEVFLRYDVLPDPPTVSPSTIFSNGFEVT